MNTDRIIVGLDIGTTKVVAVVGKYNEFGSIDILGKGHAESDGVKRGEINNIDKTVAAIRFAIEEAEKHANVEINTVHVALSGEHIRSQQQKGIITLNDPEMEICQDDLDRLAADMHRVPVPVGMEIIHVLAQEYTVDTQAGIKDPIGMSGVRLEGNYHIVMAQSNSIRNLSRCIRRAGLEIAELVYAPIAGSYSVLSDEEKEAGVCLVDIGGGTTDIAIFEDSIIRHTAVIPFGGHIVTEDIKQGCNVMTRQAELLKTRYGSAKADALEDGEEIITITGLSNRPPKEIRSLTLANIIQARMEEILEFVHLELQKSGYQNKLVGGIVLTGGGSQLQHMADLVEYMTGIDCRVGQPGPIFGKGMVAEIRNAQYSTATGLVAFGLQADGSKPEPAAATDKRTQRKPQQTAAIRRHPEAPGDPAAHGSGIMSRMKTWFESTVTGGNNID